MEPSNFEAWLGGVAQLSSLQRKIVFRVLALAEAADPNEEEAPSSPPVEKPTEKWLSSRDQKNSGAAVVIQEGRHNCDLFNQIARQRIARSGCPHCGSVESVCGAAPTAFPATDARLVARRSIRSPPRRWPGCTRRIAGSIRPAP